MRTATKNAEWDGIWARYDLSTPPTPTRRQAPAIPQAGNRSARWGFLLALVALGIPFPTPLLSDEDVTGGLPREAVTSFSPVEAVLPPVGLAVARLAAESATAACWVLQLQPQGGGCGAAP
ncbi:hypothetical protein ACFQS7_00935 [Dankookia sp. GCM10030260]|uniref:hypothetical protein n=1 Tax=Dankookia sp. GCM10030260 TaxID=3273390 RepID=UPI003623996D